MMQENLGEVFASHIDNARYEEAGELISDDCVYRHENTVHKGRKGIVAMYRELQNGMKPHFDEIKYESEVEVIDGETCKVHYFDEYRKGDRTHRIRTEEVLKFADGKIISIEQLSNHGEAMAFRKFFQETRKS
jgi:predicted SnoaL-like aldol condensation-catalyzing enzyme